MLNKGLLLACALALLSACDSSSKDAPAPADKPAASAPAATPAPKREDPAVLAKRYADRELTVLDVSEVQLDGASTLSVSFSAPLDANQDFASKVHLVDTVKGKIDGAWELSDNQMELRLRHLEPQRKLVLTVDKGLLAVNDKRLEQESVTRLETRDMQPTVGFASRGSLLPTRLAEGLPVIALNVDKVDVEFSASSRTCSPASGQLGSQQQPVLLPVQGNPGHGRLVYSGRFDLNPARNTRETVLLPIAGIKPLQEPGVYLAVMRASGTYDYSQPATLFTLSDIGVSAHRYRDRLDVFAQARKAARRSRASLSSCTMTRASCWPRPKPTARATHNCRSLPRPTR